VKTWHAILFAAFSVVAYIPLALGVYFDKPTSTCKGPKCNGMPVTYAQCQGLCQSLQVKSYDPSAYWLDNRPRPGVQNGIQPCLCAQESHE